MAKSPITGTDSPLSLRVCINGEALDSRLVILSVSINHHVNKISSAAVILLANAENLDVLAFSPDNVIEVFASYGTSEPSQASLFVGLIVKHELDISSSNIPRVILHCKHFAIKMAVSKVERLYTNLTDSAIMQEVIKQHGLLRRVDKTEGLNECVIQQNACDWDFLLEKANANDLLLLCDGSDLSIVRPEMGKEPVLTVTFGESIIEFSGTVTKEDKSPLDAALRKEYARLGTVRFQGNAISPADIIELNNLGNTFNGAALVSGVSHTLEEGNWQTTVDFGLERPRNMDTTSGYGASLRVGQIVSYPIEEAKSGKVLVSIPFETSGKDLWAEFSTHYSGDGYGVNFIPEIGDSVILGSLTPDWSRPVVLATLQPNLSSEDNQDNAIKSIITRSKLELSFNDNSKVVTIKTPASNCIHISDDSKSIELADQNGNAIRMSPEGIELISSKSMRIKTSGDLIIESVSNIAIEASHNLTLSGLNITNTAAAAFTAKGNASAELSASGQTSIEGAIVKIN